MVRLFILRPALYALIDPSKRHHNPAPKAITANRKRPMAGSKNKAASKSKSAASKSNAAPQPLQQRLVLIATAQADGALQADVLASALSGGDVASVIIAQAGLEETAFLKTCDLLVPVAQAAGAAAIIAGDSRAAGRSGADGIHLRADPHGVAEAVTKAKGRIIVGADAGKTRDQALDVGEARPDYILIGKLDGDTHPEPHPRNLELAAWWADIIEIPAIIVAGSTVQSAVEAAATGVEFVALGQAVFGAADPAEAVRDANALLAARTDQAA
jgi:thiamine-phosphate pyrophosphorylase